MNKTKDNNIILKLHHIKILTRQTNKHYAIVIIMIHIILYMSKDDNFIMKLHHIIIIIKIIIINDPTYAANVEETWTILPHMA